MSYKGHTLSEHLAYWRAERPSEWIMDEFIQDATELEAKYKALEARIDELEAAIIEARRLHLESAKPFDDAGMVLLEVMKK